MSGEIVKNSFKVVKIYNPFERHKRIVETVDYSGQNIETIVKDFYKTICKKYSYDVDFKNADEHIAVSLNGLIIPKEKWFEIIPQEKDFITISPIIGKGQKEKLVLGIVLMVVSFGFYGAPFAAASATMTATTVTMANLAFGIGAAMALGALSPRPKKPSNDIQGDERSQTHGWEPATLQRQGISQPRFYGRNKLYGNVIATHTELTETASNLQRLKVLLSLGIGPIRGIRELPEQEWLPSGTVAVWGYCASYTYIDDVVVKTLNNEILMEDDFNDGNVDGWTLVNDCESGSPTFINSSNTGRLQAAVPYAISRDEIEERGAFAKWDEGVGWTDFVFSCKIKCFDVQQDPHGIMFRYTDRDNYYRFGLDGRRKRIRLVRRKNGETSVLYSRTFTTKLHNQDRLIEITCRGPEIIVKYGASVAGDLAVVEYVDNDVNMEINNQPASNFPGVTYRTRDGLVSQENIEWFDKTQLEFLSRLSVSSLKPRVYRTPDNDFDSLSIDISFPRGLYHLDSTGFINYTVAFKIEIKKAVEGEAQYLTITKSDESITERISSNVIRTYNTLRRKVAAITKANPGVVTVDDITGLKNGDTVWLTNVTGMPEIENEEHTIANINTVNKTFEIGDTSEYTAAATAAICHKDLVDIIERGNYYDIRVTKLTADQSVRTNYGDNLYLDRVREIYNESFTYPRDALVALNIIESETLSGSFGFSCIADGLLCRVYDYNAPSGVDPWCVKYTTNPAWVLFDILTQPVYSGSNFYEAGETVDDPLTVVEYEGIDPSRLDLDRFIEYARFCDIEIDNPDKLNITNVTVDEEALITTATEHDFIVGDDVVVQDVNQSQMVEFPESTKAKVTEILNKKEFKINYNTSEFTPYNRGLLLHFDGTDGDTFTVDSSTLKHLFAFHKNAQIDTAQKKFGASSLLCDSGSYIYAPNSTSWQLTQDKNADFTVDCQVRLTEHAGTGFVICRLGSSTTNQWGIYHTDGSGLTFSFRIGGVSQTTGTTTSSGEITDTNWHHICLVKKGGGTPIYAIYLDGVQVFYTTSEVEHVFDSSFFVNMGSTNHYGHIDEFCVRKGNPFNANPNSGRTDTIIPPTAAYDANSIFDLGTHGKVAKVKHFMEFNGGFDESMSVWDAAMKICRLFRCALIPVGTKYTLAIDKRKTPEMLFSAGNITKDSFREYFLPMEERASELEVNFRDAKRRYERSQLTIFNPNLELPNNKTTEDFFGITDAVLAETMANYQLKKNQKLHRTIDLEVDVDALANIVGDCVNIQHDMPDWGFVTKGDGLTGGGGNVLSATNEGNAVVKINRKLPDISVGIVNVSNDSQAVITTQNPFIVKTGDSVTISGVGDSYMVEFADDDYEVVDVIDEKNFIIDYDTSGFTPYIGVPIPVEPDLKPPIGIIGVSNDSQAVITTQNSHGFSLGDTVHITGVDNSYMEEFADDDYEVTEIISSTKFKIDYDTTGFTPYIGNPIPVDPDLTESVGIIGVSNDVQAIITTQTAHGYSQGDTLYIAGVNASYMTQFADGDYEITEVIDSTHFKIDYDTSAFTPYLGSPLDDEGRLLLHLDSDLTDSSANNLELLGLEYTIDTDVKKFGAGSLRFSYNEPPDPSGNIQSKPTEELNLMTDVAEDWTVDFWFRKPQAEISDTLNFFMAFLKIGEPYSSWSLNYSEIDIDDPEFGEWRSFGTTFSFNDGVNPQVETPTDIGIIEDTDWHHICLVKKGGVETAEYGLYLDGVQIAYIASDVEFSIEGGLVMAIFNAPDNDNIRVDELHIAKANVFSASPNAGLTDSFSVPTQAPPYGGMPEPPAVPTGTTQKYIYYPDDMPEPPAIPTGQAQGYIYYNPEMPPAPTVPTGLVVVDTVYELMVKFSDTDLVEVKKIIDYDYDNDLVTVEGTFSKVPQRGDIFAAGVENLVTKPFIIERVERTSELKAKLTCIEYVDEIYDDDPEEE